MWESSPDIAQLHNNKPFSFVMTWVQPYRLRVRSRLQRLRHSGLRRLGSSSMHRSLVLWQSWRSHWNSVKTQLKRFVFFPFCTLSTSAFSPAALYVRSESADWSRPALEGRVRLREESVGPQGWRWAATRGSIGDIRRRPMLSIASQSKEEVPGMALLPAVRAVFPGASKFFEQLREDWEGLPHRTSGQRMQHLIVTGLGGLCGRPGDIQPGGCMFAHVQHIQGGGRGSTTPIVQSSSRSRGLWSPAGLCRRSRCNFAVVWSGGG